jgi:hypothetical protein
MWGMEIVIPPLREVARRIPVMPTLAMLVAGGLALWALSSPDAPLYLNVTRDQYKQSLGKWQALAVREYQAEVAKEGYDSYCARGCSLHVRTDGQKAEIVGEVARPGLAGMSKTVPRYSLQRMTIEEMFEYINGLLPGASDVSPTGNRRAVLGGMHYTVRFNPGMGYPESLDTRVFDDRFNITQWLGVYEHSDLNWVIRVKSLNVTAQEHK